MWILIFPEVSLIASEFLRGHLVLEILIKSGGKGKEKIHNNSSNVFIKYSSFCFVLYSQSGVRTAVWKMSTGPLCHEAVGKCDVQEDYLRSRSLSGWWREYWVFLSTIVPLLKDTCLLMWCHSRSIQTCACLLEKSVGSSQWHICVFCLWFAFWFSQYFLLKSSLNNILWLNHCCYFNIWSLPLVLI